MGSLIFRLGLEMPVLEQLEKAQKTQYDQIFPFMRENQIEPGFYTPKSHCTFVKDPDEADTTICLLSVTTTQAEAVKSFRLAMTKEMSRSGSQLLVFIDNMQTVNWEHSAYKELDNQCSRSIQRRTGRWSGPIFVPISSKDGDNLLDLSKKSSWYSSGRVQASGCCSSD